jgi:thiamine pyrophosphokinase
VVPALPVPSPVTPDRVADGHVLVFAGGEAPLPSSLRGLPPADRVIAADSGLDHARALGVVADVLIGDLDSVSDEGRALAVADGVEVIEHPSAKDQTDLELALGLALEAGPARITVVGGHGGRLDHLLANVWLLASPALAAVEVHGILGRAKVTVVRSRATLAGRVGELVSLLPAHGPVEGVTTVGLRYGLDAERLPAGSPRGVSNDFVAPLAVVTVRAGTLVVVQPEALR